jgi:dTDP-glucose 4,6-dehydratase
MKQRIVVAGGAGFIGSHLCERLIQGGDEIVCVDNYLTGSRSNVEHLIKRGGCSLFEADIVTDELLVRGQVDVVFHLASPASPLAYLSHPLETLRAGSTGTENVLELARQKNARIVFASTSEVYGEPLVHPQPESYWGNVNPIGPRSVYDESKRYAEALCTAYRLIHEVDVGIVRIFNTYGPRMRPDDGRAVPTFIKQALRGDPLTVAGDGSQTRSLCHVEDLVRGLILMAKSSEPGPVNLGNPQEVTMLDLAGRVLVATGSTSPVTFCPRPHEDPTRRRPDITTARRILGWRPKIDLDEGLAATVGSCRAASGGSAGSPGTLAYGQVAR